MAEVPGSAAVGQLGRMGTGTVPLGPRPARLQCIVPANNAGRSLLCGGGGRSGLAAVCSAHLSCGVDTAETKLGGNKLINASGMYI